jgi:hypothetical protein
VATTGHYRCCSPDLDDGELTMVMVSSKVVTTQAAAVRTLVGLISPHWRGEEHY